MRQVETNSAGVPAAAASGTLTIVRNFVGADSNTSSTDSATTKDIFVCPLGVTYQVVSVTERHSVVGSSTLMLVKALGSTPTGSGINVLASTIDLTSAINVVNYGTIFNSTTRNQVNAGDALGIRWGATNLAPVGSLTVVLNRV